MPTGTDFVAGKKRKIAVVDPVVACLYGVAGGPANFAFLISSLASFRNCLLAAFLFAFTDGIALPLRTTLTLAFMPGWTVQ